MGREQTLGTHPHLEHTSDTSSELQYGKIRDISLLFIAATTPGLVVLPPDEMLCRHLSSD